MTSLKLYPSYLTDGGDPALQSGLGLEAGDIPGGRMEHRRDEVLPLGLQLNERDGHAGAEVPAFDMAQLMHELDLQEHIREARVQIDAVRPVVVQENAGGICVVRKPNMVDIVVYSLNQSRHVWFSSRLQ